MDWIAVLKDWQSLIGGILTIAAAFIGGGYVVSSTNKQIALVSSQFKETIRPFVVARLSTRAQVVFMLEIENIGQSPASNLRLSIDKDFYEFGETRNLRDLAAFNRAIQHFAPKERLAFNLSQGFNMDNAKDGLNRTPHTFTIRAQYQFDGAQYDESYVIDTEHYMMTAALRSNNDHLDEIAKSLKKLAERH